MLNKKCDLLKRNCLSLIRLAVWSTVTQPSCPSCKDCPQVKACIVDSSIGSDPLSSKAPHDVPKPPAALAPNVWWTAARVRRGATINTNLYSLYYLMPAARHDSADRGRRYQKKNSPILLLIRWRSIWSYSYNPTAPGPSDSMLPDLNLRGVLTLKLPCNTLVRLLKMQNDKVLLQMCSNVLGITASRPLSHVSFGPPPHIEANRLKALCSV